MKFWNDLNTDLKKKLRLFAIIIGAVLAVIFLIILLMRVVNKPTPSYTLAEREMKNAAVAYYQKNASSLPTNNNGIVTVSSNTLVAEKYMKELSKLVPGNVSCSGEVTVIKNGEHYLYAPKLDCGDAYKTNSLQQYMTSHVTTSGNGIYAMNQGYVYRGEKVANYLNLNGKKWRIVKMDGNGVITLIYQDSFTSAIWDNRYNANTKQNDGYNDFNISRIKDTLTKVFEGTGYSKNERLFDDKSREKLIPYHLCHGTRSSFSDVNDGSLECSEIVENQYIGLLPLSDYLNASLDSNCHTGKDFSCQNYNYLYRSEPEWWTMTKVPDTNYKVFYITNSGIATSSVASEEHNLRPVVFLNASASIIASGTGTATDPFVLQ